MNSTTKVVDISDFSRDELMEMIKLLGLMRDNSIMFRNDCAAKTLLSVFTEPQARTQTVLSAAMTRLGGTAFPFPFDSAQSFKDNILAACAAGDILAVGHEKRGAALAASVYATVPVLNAADFSASLPVQALRDIGLIWYTKNHISNMTIGFVGDLGSFNEMRGIIRCLSVYNGNRFVFCDPKGGALPSEIAAVLEANGKRCEMKNDLADMIEELDVLYMTRITPEELPPAEAARAARRYTLDERLLMAAKPDLIILHACLRGAELPEYIDNDRRAKYYMQQEFGVYAAMALISRLFKGRPARATAPKPVRSTHGMHCGHPDCITSIDEGLPNLFFESGDDLVCSYCKNKVER